MSSQKIRSHASGERGVRVRVSICAGVSGHVHVYLEQKVAAKPRAWRFLATFVQHQVLKEGTIQVPLKSADSGRNQYDTRCVYVLHSPLLARDTARRRLAARWGVEAADFIYRRTFVVAYV